MMLALSFHQLLIRFSDTSLSSAIADLEDSIALPSFIPWWGFCVL